MSDDLDAPFDRAAMLQRLQTEHFDVLVVGGGITGVYVALDAASRGLQTALVERDDFASGTSSKSSKLVHGGLRYLQQGEVRLVYEALRERQRLRTNAPHLVGVMPFMIPILGKPGAGQDTKSVVSRKIARALGSAMWMYDLTGGWRIGKLHRRLRAEAALAHMPTMPADRVLAAYLYYDAAVDDARLVLTVARTAAAHGAAVANGCRVVDLTHDDSGRVTGVVAEADGRQLTVRARVVVNAAGVWSDEVRTLDEGVDPDGIRPAKGVHLTVPWSKVRNDIAVVIPVPKDKRSLFVVPWGPNGDGTFRHTYVGTTDTDYQGPLDAPQCTVDDIAYVLRALNASVDPAVSGGITVDDVTGVWAGLRPLVKSAESGRTADLSRRHQITRSARGVVTVTGGKLTTSREMAEDTVDEVLDLLGRRARCRTGRLKLLGAVRPDRGSDQVQRDLVARHGALASAVRRLADGDPSLLEPLVPGLPYRRVEAVWAVTHEMARTLDDVLSRRTRARLLDRRATVAAADEVARLIAPHLGWDDAEVARQVQVFRADCADEAAAGDVSEAEYLASVQPSPTDPST
ncbi:MAG: glycerol-3-phosphate dehydrogenase/oxidase [Acidimicrobiales bacterium]